MQKGHRHKHTYGFLWKTVVFKERSEWGGYSAAPGTNTVGPREVSDNTVNSQLFTLLWVRAHTADELWLHWSEGTDDFSI